MDTASIRANFEARSKAAEELRSLYDDAAGREMTAEERQTEERLSDAISDYDRRIEAGLKAAEDEKRQAEAFQRLDLNPEPKGEETRSDGDLLRAVGRGEVRGEDFLPTEVRDDEHVKGIPADGGNTVPTTFYAQIMEALEEQSTVLVARATVIRTASGEDIVIPTATDFPEAELIGEAEALTNQKMTFGRTTIGAYKLGFTMEASSELLNDSAVNIAAYLAGKGGEALGNTVGKLTMIGTGSNQPQGILAASGGLDTVTGSGETISVEDAIDLVHSVRRPYRSGAVFIASDAAVAGLRKLKDENGQFLWQPSTQAGTPDTFLGYSVLTDPVMTNEPGDKVLVFGNLNKAVMVRFAGPMRVEASQDFGFDRDVTTWRFITRFDSKVVDRNAAKVLVTDDGAG